MKTCDEMMNSLLERCEAYRAAQKKKKKILLSTTAPLCLVALMGVVLWQSGWMTAPTVTEPGNVISTDGSAGEKQPVTTTTPVGEKPSTVTEPQGSTAGTQGSTKPTLPSNSVLWDDIGNYLTSENVLVDTGAGYSDSAYCYKYGKMCGINLGDLIENNETTDKIALFVRAYSYTSTLFEFEYNGKTIAEYQRDIGATSGDSQALRDIYDKACRAYQRYAAVQLKNLLEQKGFDCCYTEGAEYLIFFATEKEFASLTLGKKEDLNWKYDWATESMPMLAKGAIDREFVYNGKTVDEHYAKYKYYYDNLETKFYNLIHEEGELLEMGEDLYLTKDPNGNPWPDICGEPFTKQTYDNYVKYYGDMLTKYIVDGKFLKEKAQADWDALKKEKEKDRELYEEACEASQKHGTAKLKKKLEKLGYECTYIEDGKGVIFHITNQDYITLPTEVKGYGNFRWVKLNDDGSIADIVYDGSEMVVND